MKKNPTSSQSSLLALVQYLLHNDIPIEKLAKLAQCETKDFFDVDKRFDFWHIQKIWQYAKENLKTENLGINVGLNVSLSHIGVLGYVLLNAPTLKEFIYRVCHYHKLISEGVLLDVVDNNRSIGIKCSLYTKNVLVKKEPIEAFFAATLKVLNEYMGLQIKLEKLELDFEVKNIQLYQDIFHITPEMNKEHSIMWFKKELMETKFIGSDKELYLTLSKRADCLLENLNDNSFVCDVKKIIIKSFLEYEKPSLDLIANTMSYSIRSIQYKLSKYNYTYSSLLEEVRKEMIQNLLKQNTSISNISFILGYSDLSSFNKAFKKWFKVSPSEYKNSLSTQL